MKWIKSINIRHLDYESRFKAMFSLNKNLVENIASILLGEKIGKFLQYRDKLRKEIQTSMALFQYPSSHRT